MLNFFKRLFVKKPVANIEQSNSVIASITIENNHDGSLNITCDWPEFNVDNYDSMPNVAKAFASSIYSINNGILAKDIIDTLKNHDKTNPYNSVFVNNVFSELINMEKYSAINQSYNPLISPLEVFKTE